MKLKGIPARERDAVRAHIPNLVKPAIESTMEDNDDGSVVTGKRQKMSYESSDE